MQAHLLLAKCYKGRGELKRCIESCNSAIEHNSKWKEPFLYRAASFQALHAAFLDTEGDTAANIARDRAEADIVVDTRRPPSDLQTHREDEARRRLLRRGGEKVPLYVDRLDEALRVAENGQKIFIEAGMYTVSQGGSSYYVFGKNVSLVGASTRDCVLLYQNTETSAPAPASPNLETFLICAGSGEPTLVKRLTFRNANSGDVKTKFFGIGGGHVQIEVSKYFVRKYLAMM